MPTADDGWNVETPAALRDRHRNRIVELETELAAIARISDERIDMLEDEVTRLNAELATLRERAVWLEAALIAIADDGCRCETPDKACNPCAACIANSALADVSPTPIPHP